MMKLSYDAEGDILYLDFVGRHVGQVTRSIGDGLLAEVNIESGELEGLEVWNFRQRASEDHGIDVPFELPALTEQAVSPVS